MRLTVVSTIAAPAPLRGYLRRFLHEFDSGIFLGTATAEFAMDVAAALERADVRGFVAIAAGGLEVGFRVLYFRYENRLLADFDGVVLIENASIPSWKTPVQSDG